MTIDPFILMIVLIGTLIISGVCVINVRGLWQRLLLLGMFSGLCFYSGIGAAYSDVPNYYLLYYFGFLSAFAFAFWFFKAVFVHLGNRSGQVLPRALDTVDSHRVWPVIIIVNLVLHFIPLIYPEIRLQQLLAPPAPDLLTFWSARWVQERDIFLKLADYVRLLLTPFFYIALYRYRQRLILVALLLGLPLYLQYINNAYIGRGHIMIAFATFWLALWVARQKYRKTVVFFAVIAIPLMLMASHYYGVIRIGGTPGNVKPVEAVVRVLETEISFPRNVGVPIIESKAKADLVAYARWMFTLPVPKLLTGEIDGARINYEISELILGIGRGARGWYVVLPGIVAESIYIFGRYFFWLHAVFVAFLAALVLRLMERTPQLLFFQAYVVILFAYHLNRGGISGPLAILVNEFMLFYLFVVINIITVSRRQHISESHNKQLRGMSHV